MIICADPKASFEEYKEEILEAINDVLSKGKYILGENVSLLEHEFARYIGVNYCAGVASGTDALSIALRALGISNPNDEVITVSHTAVATVAAIELVSATPVLADVDIDTYTVSVDDVEKLISKKTKAIIAVHLYGHPCKIDKLKVLCEKHGIALIEDVSQAHGSEMNGIKLGAFGDIACYSCYPTKNLGCFGDGGLITTNNSDLYEKIKLLREYGWESRYISVIFGMNSRLDEIQAAILRIKLRHLDNDNKRRIAIANLYNELLAKKGYDLPKVYPNCKHVYHLYVIRTKNRDDIIKRLIGEDIHPGIHYPVPIHLQPAYYPLLDNGKLSITESISKEVLSLPMYPQLSLDSVKKICEVL